MGIKHTHACSPIATCEGGRGASSPPVATHGNVSAVPQQPVTQGYRPPTGPNCQPYALYVHDVLESKGNTPAQGPCHGLNHTASCSTETSADQHNRTTGSSVLFPSTLHGAGAMFMQHASPRTTQPVRLGTRTFTVPPSQLSASCCNPWACCSPSASASCRDRHQDLSSYTHIHHCWCCCMVTGADRWPLYAQPQEQASSQPHTTQRATTPQVRVRHGCAAYASNQKACLHASQPPARLLMVSVVPAACFSSSTPVATLHSACGGW